MFQLSPPWTLPHLSLRAPLLKEEETILLYLFLLLFFISLVLLGLPMVKGMW